MPGGQSVGAIYVDAILNNKGFKSQVNSTVKGAESAFASSFKKVGAAIGAALSVAAVTAFGKSCVQAAMQAESAFMGLESILSSQNKSFSQAEKFLQEYTKDGLIPLTAAANAYKTFASAGFDTKQIEDMMRATKDMATYGRQSHYDMGGALEAFAQGVKNEESALTDAAGMTTNLSVIYEQYAASIGKTAATLSEAEKNQAIYTATMQEWTAVSGDAAKMSNTFQGRLAALKSTLSSIKTEIGNVIIPILDLFMPALQAAANAVLKFVQRIKELLAVFGLEMKTIGGDSGAAAIADGYSAAAGSAGAAADAIKGTGDAAKSAAKAVKRALAPYDELNKLTFGGSASGSSGGGSGGSGGGASTGGDVTASVTKKETGVDSAVSGMSESLKKFIDTMAEEFSVDKNRIYLCGLSMGGFGTWYTAMAYPEMFAAIAPCCGGGMAWNAGVLTMPIRTFHGLEDNVVSPHQTMEMIDALKDKHPNFGYELYEGVGHDSWKRAFSQELLAWMLDQHK